MADYPGIQQKISQAAQTIRAAADVIGEIETEIYRGATTRGTTGATYHNYSTPTYPIGGTIGANPGGPSINPNFTGAGIDGTIGCTPNDYASGFTSSIPNPWNIPPQGNFAFGTYNPAIGPSGPINPYGPTFNPYTSPMGPMGAYPWGIQGNAACNCGPSTTGYAWQPTAYAPPAFNFGSIPSFPATPSPYNFAFPQTPFGCMFPNAWGMAAPYGIPTQFGMQACGIPAAYGIPGCTPIIGYANFGYPMNWTWNWDRAAQGAWGTPVWNPNTWNPNAGNPSGWTANGQTTAGCTPQG
jgi:hypothetical protein